MYYDKEGNPVDERKEQNGRTPPVKEGDELELECIGIGKKDNGVFKQKGFTIFEANRERIAVHGKRYKLKVTRVLATYGFAEVLEEVL